VSRALGLERQSVAQLETDKAGLDDALAQARGEAGRQAAEITRLTALAGLQERELEDRASRIASIEEQVATLLAGRDAARDEGAALTADLAQLDAARTRLVSEQEALQLALARARDEIDAQAEQARLAAARREALEALTAELQATVTARETSLADALAALTAKEGE